MRVCVRACVRVCARARARDYNLNEVQKNGLPFPSWERIAKPFCCIRSVLSKGRRSTVVFLYLPFYHATNWHSLLLFAATNVSPATKHVTHAAQTKTFLKSLIRNSQNRKWTQSIFFQWYKKKKKKKQRRRSNEIFFSWSVSLQWVRNNPTSV